jgi:hypothetical protein
MNFGKIDFRCMCSIEKRFRGNMQLREKLLIAIEEISRATNLDEAHKIARELSLFSLEHGEFHIEGLAYGTFISRLFSNDILSDKSVLANIKRQVEQRNFQPFTYAIKYDFTGLLDEIDTLAFQQAKEFLLEISNNQNVSIYDSDKQLALLSELREYSKINRIIMTVPEIILHDTIQILILLPYDRSSEYSLRLTGYNPVYSGGYQEQLSNQLTAATKLVDHLEGNTVFYLHIRVQPQGYVVRIR